MLLQSLLALAAFGLLVWVFLRWSAGSFKQRPYSQGTVEVLERIPLDARRCLYLVRCGDRALLLGASDGAGPHVLTEFPAQELPAPTQAQAQRFTAILKRLRHPAPDAPSPSRPPHVQEGD